MSILFRDAIDTKGAAAALDGTERWWIRQGSTSVKLTAAALATYMVTALAGTFAAKAGAIFTGAVLFSGTSHAGLVLNNLTTAQQDAVAAPATGSLIYNTTLTRPTVYNGSAWRSVGLLTDKLSAFAATSSAELAGVISDETGTGALVFATSPTLVTPALGTPGSGVLTNCTGLPSFLVANEATDTTCFPLFATAATGELGPKSNANFTFNSSTGELGAAILVATNITVGSEISANTCNIVDFVDCNRLILSSSGGNNKARLADTADGVLKLSDDANNDFGRLQFGGTSSSFPALKRSTTFLQMRLADDSGYADFAARTLVTPMTSELTIAAGVITVTGTKHRVDTEADAATDDLDTINGGIDGMIVTLRAENTARTVVVKDATGNLQIAGDMTLDNTQDTITLQFDNTLSAWLEIGRAASGA